MWFMKHIANPIVMLILRSRFHRLLSASTLLINVRGKKSGKLFTLPVQYARDGDSIIILPGGAEKKTWWRNLIGGSKVNLLIQGQPYSGNAAVYDGKIDCAEVIQSLSLYLKRFPASARRLNLHPHANGEFDAVELRNAACETLLIRVQLSGG